MPLRNLGKRPLELHSGLSLSRERVRLSRRHGSLFDSAALAESRLDELRDLMAVVWTASSDALAISVRHRDAETEGAPVSRVETCVSPTAEAMLAPSRRPTTKGRDFGTFIVRCLESRGETGGLGREGRSRACVVESLRSTRARARERELSHRVLNRVT